MQQEWNKLVRDETIKGERGCKWICRVNSRVYQSADVEWCDERYGRGQIRLRPLGTGCTEAQEARGASAPDDLIPHTGRTKPEGCLYFVFVTGCLEHRSLKEHGKPKGGMNCLDWLIKNLQCCLVLLPGLDRADLFVVVVHAVVIEANNGGLS